MPVAGGIAVMTIGAILTFALTGSIRGLDLHIVGAILMLAGAAMLLFPLVMRGRSSPGRWAARSRQDVIDDGGDGSQPLMESLHRDRSPIGDRRTRWVRRDRR